MDKKIYDLILSLRIGEKRVKRMLNNSKREERAVYDEMVKALMEGDRESAREYAKEIIKIRKYRKSLQKYWSKIRGLRADLEKASMAKELKSTLVNAAKNISKILEKMDELSIEEATHVLSESQGIFESTMSEVPDFGLSEIDKEEIEEIIKIAETEGIEKVKEMFPSVEEEPEEEEEESQEE
ncbi:MAG: Snf7 family protein [Candidatus Njordarchaeia archaeon]